MNQERGETREQQAHTDAILAELHDALVALHTVRLQIAEWERQHADALGKSLNKSVGAP